jgi:DNA-binding response OmpR family regulator
LNEKKILLIGNKDAYWAILAEELEKSDFFFSCTPDDFDAYRVVEKEMPDLILIDVIPPKLVGFSICKLIKMKPLLITKIPVWKSCHQGAVRN